MLQHSSKLDTDTIHHTVQQARKTTTAFYLPSNRSSKPTAPSYLGGAVKIECEFDLPPSMSVFAVPIPSKVPVTVASFPLALAGVFTPSYTIILLHAIRCQRHKRETRVPKSFSGEIDMDPRNVPADRRGIVKGKEMFVGRAASIVRVYRRDGGQRGYRVNVANVAQDVGNLLYRLPRASTDVLVLVVSREGHKNGTHKGILARQRRVLDAPLWLRQNKPYYENVEKAVNGDRSPYRNINAHKADNF